MKYLVCIGLFTSTYPLTIHIEQSLGNRDELRMMLFHSYAANPIRINPIFISIIFHHYEQLTDLSKEINKM